MRSLQIAYPMRVDAFDKPGGDVLQIQRYIAAGEDVATDSGTTFSGRIIVDLDYDPSPFDLIHITNLDRPAELLHFYDSAREARKPIVLSPIHHSYAEIERFERMARPGVLGRLTRRLPFSAVEGLRSAVRSMSYPVLVSPTARLLVRGVKPTQKAILDNVDRILLLCQKEGRDIVSDFGGMDWERAVYLRNGCDGEEAPYDAGPDVRDIDVCVVGRIEPRKNQLAILAALENFGIAGVFVGAENPNHRSYCSLFRRKIGDSRSRFAGTLEHANTLELMRRSKVHVSASWFEVASLVDLEAYRAGCRVVASTCGGTHEVLGGCAWYVNPAEPATLDFALSAALREAAAGPPRHQAKVDSWEEIAACLGKDLFGGLMSQELAGRQSATVGIVIPTLNAGNGFGNMLSVLRQSSCQPKILVVDSASTDDTVEQALRSGATVHSIPREAFNHGATREAARCALQAQIVVMLTQDVEVVSVGLIDKLIAPLQAGLAEVAYGRQLPRRGATIHEAFPREFNYPAQSEMRALADVSTHGTFTYFCSNSCAAYCNSAVEEVGGFPRVPTAEDTLVTARILLQGGRIAYVADAVVRHSHNHGLLQEFRRYFDAGYVRSYFPEAFGLASDHRRGAAFTRAYISKVWSASPCLLPTAITHIAVKYAGYMLGRSGGRLPVALRRLLSSDRAYWANGSQSIQH